MAGAGRASVQGGPSGHRWLQVFHIKKESFMHSKHTLHAALPQLLYSIALLRQFPISSFELHPGKRNRILCPPADSHYLKCSFLAEGKREAAARRAAMLRL